MKTLQPLATILTLDSIGPNLPLPRQCRQNEEILEEVMAVLTSQERLVLQLRFEEHLSAGNIGRASGLEEVRVRSLLRTSLSKLRREMEERRFKPSDFSLLDVSGRSP